LPNWFFESSEFQAANYIWFMGVWKPSLASVAICQQHEGLNREFLKTLPDLADTDIIGSPYSIYEYTLNPVVAKTQETLRRLKTKLNKMGKKLILDFVPNHMSVDTIYLEKYPDLFLHKEDHESLCHNSFLYPKNGRIYFYGRDPYFDGWTDTVQWDFSHPEVLELHKEILMNLSEYCDGLRCDMAMLPLPDVFEKTHRKKAVDYWEPLINHIRSVYPHFIFIGEVYWNREYDLQTLGFDYTYDKVLYDRLSAKDPDALRYHLFAGLDYQNKSLRFLENHDEERAMQTFGEKSIYKFSLLSFLPGMVLYHQGQSEGRLKKVPVQLGRTPKEDRHKIIMQFYDRAFSQISNRSEEVHSFQVQIDSYEYDNFNPLICYGLYYFKQIPLLSGKAKVMHVEILAYNPESKQITGWMKLEENLRKFIHGVMPDTLEIRDITNGDVYQKLKTEIVTKGIYLNLGPENAHWFAMDSDLMK
jgi:hypothetical protein